MKPLLENSTPIRQGSEDMVPRAEQGRFPFWPPPDDDRAASTMKVSVPLPFRHVKKLEFMLLP
jgi:hypothetical protein